jgi:hypothetical protein
MSKDVGTSSPMTAHSVMLNFKHQLLSWGAHIRKMACLESLEVRDDRQGEFTLIATWKNGGRLERHFSRQYVLGHTATSLPSLQRPRMKACSFRDEFIRSILNARGV